MNLTTLRNLALIVEPYLELRAENPGVPARRVFEYLRDDQGISFKQFNCRHEWSDPEGYRVYCLYCGLDGDM